MKIPKRFLSVLGISIFISCSGQFLYGQDQSTADSLKTVFSSGNYQKKPDTVLYQLLSDIAFNENNPDESIRYADLLIAEVSSNDQNPRWLYRGNYNKGNALRRKGDYDRAFEAMFSALKFATEANYKGGIGATLMGIADTYSVLGNSANAVNYYNQAIDEIRDTPDSVTLAIVLLNAGDEYVKSGKLDSALQYFFESAIIFNQQQYAIGQAYNMGNIGMVYAQQGKDELAVASLNEATSMLEELGDRYAIASYQYEMAGIYQKRGDLDQALDYAMESYSIGVQERLKEQIRDAALIASEIFEEQRVLDEAYKYLKVYVAYRDSINNEQIIQNMADLRREFEVSQKQLEVDLLNQQKRNQQIIGAGLILILLMAVGFLVMVYRNYQRKNRLSSELEQLNRTKDKFFSIISHDLRGPISAFNGISRMIRIYITKERYRDLESMTHDIDDSVSSISSLLDNLLNWAAQQQGHLPYNPERIQVNEMVGNIFQTFKATADAKNIQLSADIPETLSVWVDRNSAVTILRNLTSNALKFTPEGGSVSIEASEADRFGLIKVKDSGVGMNQEKLDDLFKLKDQKSTYGTSGEKGIGLGLQLVNEFTQLNKGKVEVESEEGKGTTFTISLPLARRVKEVLIEDE